MELCTLNGLATQTLLPCVEEKLIEHRAFVGTGHQGREALHPAPTCLHVVMEVEMISNLRGKTLSPSFAPSETCTREQKAVIDLI